MSTEISPKEQDINVQKVPKRYQYLINDPEARYDIRAKFYKRYGADTNILKKIWRFILWIFTGKEGLGRSELDFLRWEIDRGVLNPLDDPNQIGSNWWRDVNLEFIIISETAGEIYQGKHPNHPITNEIQLWLDYIEQRTGQAWYRAHNASIVRGYLNCIKEAKEESVFEQVFMNEVLYRLLFAQSMEEDSSIFKELGVIGANPMSPAVDIMVHIPAFYPANYPLSKEEILDVMHKGHGKGAGLEKALDEYLILPEIDKLYEEAAGWINIPELPSLLKNGKPIYPHINQN